jgi:diguanylate cyclase (GGDEF)-like protein
MVASYRGPHAPLTGEQAGAAGGAEQSAGILNAVDILERVAAEHAEWLKRWHVSVLADHQNAETKLSEIRRALAPTWLQAESLGLLRHFPRFVELTQLRTRMLDEADRLAAKDSGRRLAPVDYGRFMDAVLEFDANLRFLQHEIWNRLANIDPLTGLGNRQALWNRLGIEAERHARNRQPCCVAMIDLDLFKQVNDRHGHAAGDEMLKSVAALLAASTRPYDAVFRYGGDEFLVCLPNADCRGAWSIVERLRLKTADTVFSLRAGIPTATTISIGIAALTSEQGVETTLERADEALYVAKRNGRNGIYVWNAATRGVHPGQADEPQRGLSK